MDDGLPPLQLIEDTETGVLAVAGNLVVSVHARQLSPAAMERMGRAFDDVLGEYPEGICVLWISLTRQTNPDDDAMRDRVCLLYTSDAADE